MTEHRAESERSACYVHRESSRGCECSEGGHVMVMMVLWCVRSLGGGGGGCVGCYGWVVRVLLLLFAVLCLPGV